MPEDRLQLAVRDPAAPRAIPVSEYLRGRADHSIEWEPYLGHVVLDLNVGGVEVWPYDMTIGDLPRVVVQFEHGAARLESGREALVRQALDDSREAVLLAVEPGADSRASLSMVVITEFEPSRWYPALWWHEENTALYDYVREHRAQVGTPPAPDWEDLRFHGPSAPTAWVAESMRREAALGRELHDALGIPFDPDRFV